MKSKEVLRLLKITRLTLTKYIKEGWITSTKTKNGFYNYDNSVCKFLNKRQYINKQKGDI